MEVEMPEKHAVFSVEELPWRRLSISRISNAGRKPASLRTWYMTVANIQGSLKISVSSQVRDASGLVMRNIAADFEAGSNPEFIRFLKMSRRSASEGQSELYLALDRLYITQVELDSLMALPPKPNA